MDAGRDHGRSTTTEPTGGAGRLAAVGLRGRLLSAILVVAVTTVGVGAFGISRMSTLSARADQVYTDGALPLDGLRTLQATW